MILKEIQQQWPNCQEYFLIDYHQVVYIFQNKYFCKL